MTQITPEQYTELLSYNYDKTTVMQLAQWVFDYSYEPVIEWVNRAKKENLNVIYDSPFTEEYRNMILYEQEKYQRTAGKINIAGKKCRHCDSSDLTYEEVQTRRGDEAFTLKVTCLTCGKNT